MREFKNLLVFLHKPSTSGLEDETKLASLTHWSLLLIQILLKPGECLADFIRFAQVGNSIGNGVVIFQFE